MAAVNKMLKLASGKLPKLAGKSGQVKPPSKGWQPPFKKRPSVKVK